MIKGYTDISELHRNRESKSSQEEHIDYLNARIEALQKELKRYQQNNNVQTEIYNKEGKCILSLKDSNVIVKHDKDAKNSLYVMVCEI